MTILVTGASGLLGSNLILETQSKNVNIVAIDHLHKVHIPGVTVVHADLTDLTIVGDIVNSFKPDWIFNCASITNVDWCEIHPEETWAIHVIAPHNLAVAARKIGAKLVYISTDSVFDGLTGSYCENDPCNPLNVYAVTKLAGEKVVQEDLPSSLIIRTNIYGWNLQNKQSLAEWMFSKLVNQEPLLGFHDVIFTPMLVNDLANILFEMIDREMMGVYHVAGSLPCSKFDFAMYLAETFNLNSKLIQAVSINDSPLKAPRPKDTSLQTSKVIRAIKRPMPDVLSGLNRFRSLLELGAASLLKTWQEV